MRESVILARMWAARRPWRTALLRQPSSAGFALALKASAAVPTVRKTAAWDTIWAPVLCAKVVVAFPVMTNADRSGSKLGHRSPVSAADGERLQPGARSPLWI